MPKYRFLQGYTAPHRLTGTAQTRIFSSGELVFASRYIPPAGTSKAILSRMAPSVLIDNQYIVPLSVLRVERTSNAAGTAIPVPENKTVDVKKIMGEVSSGGTKTGAIIGVIGGALIAYVLKKNVFIGAGIGMIAGGGVGYFFSMNSTKQKDVTEKK